MYGEFDVVVIGGGPAGLMAAASASRSGRSTILLERYGFLGGAGAAGGLSTFCGLHAKIHGEHRQVIHGLADELLDRMAKLDGLARPHLTINDGITAQAYDISAYKIAAASPSTARLTLYQPRRRVSTCSGGGRPSGRTTCTTMPTMSASPLTARAGLRP